MHSRKHDTDVYDDPIRYGMHICTSPVKYGTADSGICLPRMVPALSQHSLSEPRQGHEDLVTRLLLSKAHGVGPATPLTIQCALQRNGLYG